MKNLILIILLLCLSFHAKAQWYYGAGEATDLENQIGFDKHQQKIVTGQSDDPSIVAKYGSAGSIYLKTDGTLWTKKDAGTSTNWTKFVDTAAQITSLLPYATNAAVTASLTNYALSSTLSSYATNASTTASLSLKVDLSTTASVGSVLTSNGSSWVAGNPVPVGVGNGIAFYLDDTASDIATYFSLLRNPSNVAEILDTVAVTSGTSPVAIENYASSIAGLGDTSIDSGTWIFSTYGSVSAVGGPICTIRASVYKRTSGGVKTLLFTSPDTPTLTTTVTLYDIETVQPSFAINSTDRLIVKFFATNTSGTSRNVTLYHNGTSHYSHVHTPITQRHNDLAGLQGGTTGDYQHLTSAQVSSFASKTASVTATGPLFVTGVSGGTANLTIQQSNGTVGGFLSSADWNTFNNKMIGGTGTTDKLTKWVSTGSITDSSVKDDGVSVTTTLPLVTTGSLTAQSILNINRDNLMIDGGFESGISEIVCSSGVCTNDATAAIGSKSLKIATTSTTASVTWSKVNAALANRDLGIDLELSSTNSTMQLCGQALGVTQNCVPMAIVGSYGRLSTYVTADSSGNFGWVVQSSTATSTTVTNIDNAHVTTNPFTYTNVFNATDWTTLTYTQVNALTGNQGFGTFTAGDYEWRREGSNIIIKGKLTTGTTTSSEARLPLPLYNGVQLVSAGTSIIPSVQAAGINLYGGSGAISQWALIEPNVSYITFGQQNSGGSGLSKFIGTTVTSGTAISFYATIPIQGWTSGTENIVTPAKSNMTDWAPLVVTAATSQGFGTIGTSEVQTRRVGSNLEIRGKIVNGTVSASEAQIFFPTGLLSASTLVIPSVQVAGAWFIGATNTNHGGTVLIEPAKNYITFGENIAFGSSSGNPLTKISGSAMGPGTGGTWAFFASIPIEGWTSNATFLAAIPVDPPTAIYNGASGQSIAASSTTQIVVFGTMEKDNYGQVVTNGTSTWEFTAKRSGVYSISSSIAFLAHAWAPGDILLGALFKNGVISKTLGLFVPETTTPKGVTLQASANIYLNTGDVVDLRAYQTHGTGVTLTTDITQNFISITRLGN